MKIYVKAKSKADINRRLEQGEQIYGENYSMFGGAGIYRLDEDLERGTVIAVFSQMSMGNPVAKSWGQWTGKRVK